MAQQTALSWLKDMLEWNYGDPKMLEISWENLDDLLERAKQIEKQNMYKCASFWRGKENEIEKPMFDEYYKETFKK